MATDNFNRADGALGANWTQTTSEGALIISGNQVTEGSVGEDEGAWYNAVAFANDQYSQWTLTTIATAGGGVGTGQGVGVREANGARTYYRVMACAAGTELEKRVAGAGTSLKTDATVWANGDIIRLEVTGSAIVVKRNGSTIAALSTTDIAIASGAASIKYSSAASNTPVADDWDGGDLAGGAGATAPRSSSITMLGMGR